MIQKTMIGIVLAAALAAGGCATRASGVTPVAVSVNDYAAVECVKLAEDLRVARSREDALTDRQDKAATLDAVGVFVAFLPIGSLMGKDVKGELAQAKGETLAIERSLKTRCEA